MSAILRAHLALAAVALIYGANYLVAKSLMPDPIGPNGFILLRVLGATVLFWAIAFPKMKLPAREDIGRFVLCGLTGVAVNQLLFFNGLSLTSPINSSIIMTSNPILVMIISALILKQRINSFRIAGVVMGAAGAMLLLLLSNSDRSAGSSATGDMFILINSMSYAFYLVLVKPLMKKYHPLVIITWVFTVGLFAVLPFGGLGIQTVPWESLTPWQWFSLVFVIVFVTFFAYLLNIIALSTISPSTASSYIYFQPMLAGLFSWLFTVFGDRDYTGDITWAKAGCAVLIFIGVYLVGKGDSSQVKVASD